MATRDTDGSESHRVASPGGGVINQVSNNPERLVLDRDQPSTALGHGDRLWLVESSR